MWCAGRSYFTSLITSASPVTRSDAEPEERDLTANTLLDRETWGLDDGGNWLSHSRTTGNLMETRSIDTMNRLTRTGGAGSTVVEGQVNELSTVSVNGQPAEMRADPVAGGYRFRRSVPVSEGPNTITVTAADTGNPPATTTKSWSLNVPAVARNFTYDANGNTLSDGQRTFTWDAKNRLRTVTKDGTTWKWDYDYRDRRVREYTNGILTKQYVWSGTEIIQERNASNAITRTHCFGGFADGASPTSGTKYQTLADHLGHVREVLTGDGTVAARYDYTPYQGPVKIGTSTVEPTFLTIGRYQHHAGSGLELALYRAYDPELGRWLSEDPIGESGGVNLFALEGNNPVLKIDLLGLNTKAAELASRGYAKAIADALAGLGALDAIDDTPSICPNEVHAESESDDEDAEESDPTARNPKQDKKVSRQEALDLAEELGYEDVESMKEDHGGRPAGRFDIFKDKCGRYYVKPKSGAGFGEQIK